MSIHKKVVAFFVSSVMLFSNCPSVYAADHDDWSINYIPGAPDTISNQNDRLYVAYYSDGFLAYQISIDGTNGCWLTIDSDSAGGMTTRYITNSRAISWKMNGSTAGNVEFLVRARVNYKCTSTGIIRINN